MGNYEFLQDKAYNYIKQALMSRTLTERRVYSESEFAAALGMSRTPVRAAIGRLSNEKFIDIVPSKGFVLHEITREDTVTTLQMRSAIETYCAVELLRKRRTPQGVRTILLLGGYLEEMQKLTDKRDAEGFRQFDVRFHEEIISFLNNEDFMKFHQSYLYRIEKLAVESLSYEGRIILANEEHKAIYEAIRTGDEFACFKKVGEHLLTSYSRFLDQEA